MPRKRGNPNWGQAGSALVPHVVTEFEVLVRQLGLRKYDYAASPQLRDWCLHNKDRRYVPEWLLYAWKMTVEVGYTPEGWG